MSTLAAPRLRRLVRPAAPLPAAAPADRCELCAEPLRPEHRHLLELERRELACACRACALLFDRREAGGGRWRLVPDRLWALPDFELAEADWRELGIPVGTAFVFESTRAGRPVACYPSPLGVTESQPDPAVWRRVRASHPALAAMEPDVEALLVHRGRPEAGCWLAPLDACFRLVACVRTHWRGLGGGDRVWEAIAAFFDDLQARAVPAPHARRRTP